MHLNFKRKRNKSFLFFFSILQASYAAFYSITDFLLGRNFIALILFFLALVLTVNLPFINIKNKNKLHSNLLLSCGFIISALLVYEGGIEQSGLLWIFPFPGLVFALKEKKESVFWVLSLFVFVILLVLSDTFNILAFKKYSVAYIAVALSLYILMSVSFYISNNLRKNYEKTIEEKTTELVELNKELKYLSFFDALTGIFNRRQIVKTLENELERQKRYKNPFSLILIDVDFFKKVNDNYGHLFGDLVLKKMTKVILEVLRTTDTFGRYGGEEFLIILPYTDMRQAQEVANRIRTKVKNTPFYYEEDNLNLQITVSMGISQYEDGENEDDILARADKALYRAKYQGRDQIVCFDFNEDFDNLN